MLEFKAYWRKEGEGGEENYLARYEETLHWQKDQTALVLVDVWKDHPCPTFRKRMQVVTEHVIKPVLQAAREVGLTVFHSHSKNEPAVDILDGEPCVATRGDILSASHERGIRNLVYAGFAANMCIMTRPIGVMYSVHTHDVVLLRDATTGLEYPETERGAWAYKCAIYEFELLYGHTALSEDFMEALRDN